jgi:hypothetical protein
LLKAALAASSAAGLEGVLFKARSDADPSLATVT